MTSLTTDALILSPERYAEVRPEQRAAAIELRRKHRVFLGESLVLEFENFDTLRYQAQEMLFVERVTAESAAAEEIAVYERLAPTSRSVAATLLIEIADQDLVRAELARLAGIHDAIRLEIAGEQLRARDVPPPDEGPGSRTYSVHFLRFKLSEAAIAALEAGREAALVVDHPAYQARTVLSDEFGQQLLTDLRSAG